MSAMPKSVSSPSYNTACYSVHAPVDPSVMPRVLEVFTRRGLIPSVWHSTLCGADSEEIQIDVQLADVEPRMAELVAQALRQLVCVGCVMTSEKRRSAAA
ncbi:MAG: hypothetical protein HN403_16760 [Rhodospirillales bacterium]|jgi:acetolactate synthase regulatory subunit|nr:hypothetical protein [Rhodospirillales bacterium]